MSKHDDLMTHYREWLAYAQEREQDVFADEITSEERMSAIRSVLAEQEQDEKE